MIKIFLLNIILTAGHLTSCETGLKLFGLGDIEEGICVDINTTDHIFGYEKFKSISFNSPKCNYHSADLFTQSSDVRFAEWDIRNFRFGQGNYRNSFLFFSTGVSPPGKLVV